MRSARFSLVIAATAAIGLSSVVAAAAPASTGGGGGNSDSTAVRATVDTSSAIVQLNGDPLSTYVKTRPAAGKKIDFNSNTVKAYRAQLNQVRNDFKKWLQANAPQTQVTGQFDISLNAVSVQLNGTSLDLLKTAPQVKTAQYEGLYYPTADPAIDPDLTLISAAQAWAAGNGTSANAGTNVKVGIIDTGIDITHPCFSDGTYAAQTQLGDKRYTNNKVIVARVFDNKTPSRGYTAQAIQEHGTHVAGTVACNANTPASVAGATIAYGISGVAPHALLGNYNIFPGDVLNARSEDILNALDAAYADGMDIVNMSLGGGAHGIQDLLTIAVDDLDQAGMISAVAAGNSGPGHFTVESPGSAARALTAGASTVNHQVVNPVAAGSASASGVIGEFGIPTTYPVTGTLQVLSGTGVSGLSLACSSVPTASSGDSIALVQRGVCDFSTKLYWVQQAGYKAAIVVNRIGGPPFTMGPGEAPSQPTIAGWMIGLDAADAFAAEDGATVTIGAPTYTYPFYAADVVGDFSSEGPTDVDFRVKPDVVAPGVNVLSSIPTSYCGGSPCFAFFQGTSMATPHLAGSAAVVKWAHDTWSAAEIRSAVVNTADGDALTNYDFSGTPEHDVNIVGAGREDLLAAVNARVALDPVSVSFGSVPAGSGQTRIMDVAVTSLSGAGALGATVADGTSAGVTFTASVANGHVTVTMTADKGAAVGGHQATLVINQGGTPVAHAAVYVFVKQ